MSDKITLQVSPEQLALWEALLATAAAAKMDDALTLLNVSQLVENFLQAQPTVLAESVELLRTVEFPSIREYL